MNKKKYTLIVLLVFGIIIMSLNSIIKTGNPLRKETGQIKEDLLNQFPFGTSIGDVVMEIQGNSNWIINTIDNEHGYGIDANGVPGENNKTLVGKKHIRVCMGEYFNPFSTYVIAYFGFDDNSKLIDISVRKDLDGI